MPLQPLSNKRPFIKWAFEGFAGDGKTFTATQLAIGLHKEIASQKPIAFFDTERASSALLPLLNSEGIDAIVEDEELSLASLMNTIKACEAGAADILIIDSITHVWEGLLEDYMASKRKTRLEFQDWGVLKPKWKREFSRPFVQAQIHIIFTGRAGYEYSDEKNEETGKREIFKSGIKMKAETETAFEPDVLILMQKQMQLIGDNKSVVREATIVKDRTNTIDGKSFTNPTYENFAPAVNALLNGTAKRYADAQIKNEFESSEDRTAEFRRRRETAIAEIEGAFNLMRLGTSAADKNLKASILRTVFGVLSIDSLDRAKAEVVETGMREIKAFAEKYNEYTDECAENETKTDMAHIKSLLDSCITAA